MAAEQIIRRFEQLKSNRINWEDHWQELADYVLPRKDDIFRTRTYGEKKHNKVFDSTGIHANELLASALHGMLTNPSTQWFELTTGDELLDQDDEVRLWLQTAVRQMHKVLNNSNFQTEIHEVYLDLGSFGTACMRMEEDDEEVVRFQSRPIYEAYVDQNNKGGIDTVYRSFFWTARQIKQEFGEEALTEDMLSQLEAKLHDRYDEYEIIHAVEPVTDDYDGPEIKKGHKFRSTYVLKEKKKVLSYGGFKEFPYVIPRWTKIAGEVYGRSPAMKALADIKMINQVMKTTIRSAQKTVDPPLMMPDDGILLPIKTAPGGINYYRAGSADKIEPLQTGSRVDFGFQMMEQIRMRIREAFFIDQLQLGSGPQMTATEVSQRTEEKLRLLGPILGRQQFELLRPLIDRIFNVMMRKNLFPPPPQQLSQASLQVQYSSQIAKAQRSADAQSFTRVLNIIGPLFELKPEMMDNINTDQLLRYVSRAYGLPEEVINPLEMVLEDRQARQQQQAMAEQMAQEQHESSVVKQITPAMQMMGGAE
tara:strand:- start:159 stop:1763 length:1605 start_codon:yes stop_codon:yes gene_type:complete